MIKGVKTNEISFNIPLKVYKDLFKLGLNPTELMVLSQIIEFQVNTNDCFISNDCD